VTSQRSLNVPLFSDEDFSKVEQDVREAMALKARDTSLAITSTAPAKPTIAKSATAEVKTPAARYEMTSPISDEPAIDVEGILKKLLDEKSGPKKTITISEPDEPAIEIPAPTLEPVAASSATLDAIPDLLRRSHAAPVLEPTRSEERVLERRRAGISWRLSYAIVGGLLTVASIVSGIGYTALLVAVTMAPLIDPTFYKRKD